jgi:hypothetical protein
MAEKRPFAILRSVSNSSDRTGAVSARTSDTENNPECVVSQRKSVPDKSWRVRRAAERALCLEVRQLDADRAYNLVCRQPAFYYG